MTKLAILFVAIFCAVQVSLSARIEKRDVADVEITTESFFDRIKSGLQNTFSEDNFNAAKQKIGEFGDKVKNVSTTAYTNLHEGITNYVKKDDAAPAPAPAA